MRASRTGTILLFLVASIASGAVLAGPARAQQGDPPPEEEETGGTGTAQTLDEGKMGKRDSTAAKGRYKMSARRVQLSVDDVLGGFVGLPARSADGTRLALPSTWTEDGAMMCHTYAVQIITLGEAKAEVIDLVDDPCLERDERLASLAAALPRLNDAWPPASSSRSSPPPAPRTSILP